MVNDQQMNKNQKKIKYLLTNRKRYFSIKFSKKKFNQIIKIINSTVGRKFNLESKKSLMSLSLEELKKIEANLKGKNQKKIVNIIKPEIKKFIKPFLSNDELANFRVGVQIKYKKVYKESFNRKFEKKIFKNLKSYNLPLSEDNLLFNTNPHQDLSNQGFRSSMALIFYFQLTKTYKNKTCLMSVADFKNNRKVGLFNFDNTKFYPNVIKDSIKKRLNWHISNHMKPKRIFVMDSITPHSSSPIKNVPRIAINVKIQPLNLNYLYKVFNVKKRFNKKLKENLKILENDLVRFAKVSNSLNFELSVLYLIQRKFDKAVRTFNKFTLSNFSKLKREKIFAGALFRKCYENVSKKDISNIYKKKVKFAKFSCADSLINTLKS